MAMAEFTFLTKPCILGVYLRGLVKKLDNNNKNYPQAKLLFFYNMWHKHPLSHIYLEWGA